MRYKEFSNNKVLEDCISLFWESGFNGTSVKTIVDHTKVNRFSLYREFESKQGMLYASMNLFRDRYSREYAKRLEPTAQIEEALKAFFFLYLQKKIHPSGCFVINMATELSDNDAQVNAFLKDYLQELEAQFSTLLNTYEQYQPSAESIASNLVLLFCNSMCYCHIQEEKESQDFISLNLEIILNK